LRLRAARISPSKRSRCGWTTRKRVLRIRSRPIWRRSRPSYLSFGSLGRSHAGAQVANTVTELSRLDRRMIERVNDDRSPLLAEYRTVPGCWVKTRTLYSGSSSSKVGRLAGGQAAQRCRPEKAVSSVVQGPRVPGNGHCLGLVCPDAYSGY